VERREMGQDERSPSVRYFVLGFLALVALCAVFFSLGFLIGYNQRPSKQMPVAENVSGPSEIPPTVNPPAESSTASADSGAVANPSAPAAKPPPEAPKALETAQVKTEKPAKAKKSSAAAKPPGTPVSNAAVALEKPATGAGSGYSLQVLAARTQADADSLKSRLKSGGYPAFVLSPEAIGASDTYYRVLVGPYRSRNAAEKVRRKLKKEGFKPFIRH
jgi:cell division protein FtsN